MMGLCAFVMLLAQDLGPLPQDLASSVDESEAVSPAEKKQEKKENQEPIRPQDFLREPDRLPTRLDQEGLPWIDFDWFELQPRVGMAVFSSDYRINPSFCLSVVGHVPVPALSFGGNPEGEHLGLFAEVNVIPGVKRNLDPAPSHSSGMLLFMTVGVDYTIVRNQSLYLLAEAGVQYGYYGGIADLKDGIAPVLGFAGGVYLGKGLTLTGGPEVILGKSSSRIILGSLGLLIEF